MKKVTFLIFILMGLLMLTGCTPTKTEEAPQSSEIAEESKQLNIMTHDSFSASEAVIAQFEESNNVKLNFLKSGDTGGALNRAILSKESPLADVFYGVDNTFLTRAINADIFEPYNSPELSNIDEAFILDKEFNVLPVDYGDVCINYDKAYFTDNKLALPQSLEDLLKPEYKRLLVVENPALSSPGLAFMLATISHFGEDGYLDFWKSMRENGVVVVNDWETAYYTNFSASSGRGPQPMVVSYGTSPAAEVIYADEELDDTPTASLVGDDMCYRQIEFVGILKGTKNRQLAEKFVDFMLQKEFQEDIPLQMFVYPVNKLAILPQEFVDYTQSPQNPASMLSETIDTRREQWIQDWTDTVIK